ncbi:lymphatic vessel endothelial hyaluronic receptor 1b isoform X1 [Labrus bergylta]|uniref:lymphatic vessel endothelial hyaluronic receptor 1b isoform X1 n=1 Tax=Labrus bergylta TaxID=56723 RepID=UPI003313ABE0
MARLFVFTLSLFWFFPAFLLASGSSLNKDHIAAGVFLLIEGGGVYTFNFTAARDACLFLNVTMATRAQVERAVQHGLETCKFGWIAEKVAVVPRLTAEEKCGRGKTGVVPWAANTDTKFGVFCFNATGTVYLNDMSASSPQSFTSSTTQTAVTPTSTPASPGLTLTTTSPPSRELKTIKASVLTSFTSAVHVNTTPSGRITSIPTSHKPFSTHVPTSPSRLVNTSKPTVFSYALDHVSDITFTSESVTTPTIDSEKPSLGDVPTALIILCVIVLLLTAAGVVWYYKLNIFTFWSQTQQKDDIETEMWKHTSSEMDLHSLQDGEEEDEESDRKYSSDITLCVNPDTKTNSSE